MRRFCLAIGLAVLVGLWLGPLPALAAHAFWAHMAMHMGVVAVASAFLGWGLAGSTADPSLRWPALFSPIAASLGELVVVWTWHAPGLHAFARGSHAGLVLEQGSFVLVGLWLWISAFGGSRPRTRSTTADHRTSAERGVMALRTAAKDVVGARSRRAAGIAGLLFTSMHMTLLGALLALTPRVLYDHMTGSAALTALQDQHLGGAIMLLVGGIAYLGGGLYLTAELVRGGARAERRNDSRTHPASDPPSVSAETFPASEGAP